MVLRRSQLRNALASHFSKRGLKLDLRTPESRFKFLLKLFGPERADEFINLHQERTLGLRSIQEEYEFAETVEEAAGLFSPQGDQVVDIATWLAARVQDAKRTDCVIGEMGSGAGLLVSWLAEQHADCSIVGYDRIKSFLELTSQANPLENASFLCWDYASDPFPKDAPKCDVAVSSLGIDFPPCDADAPLEGFDYDSWPEYQSKHMVAEDVLERWKDACNPRAKLYCVLRLPCLASFLGFVHAAHDSGWTCLVDESTTINTGGEAFPALAFRNEASAPLDNNLLASLFVHRKSTPFFQDVLGPPVAGLVFDQLKNKNVRIKKEQTLDDGSTMICQIGAAGPWSFRFNRSTSGFQRLEICPLIELDNLQPIFSDFPASAPIRDSDSRVQRSKKRKKRR